MRIGLVTDYYLPTLGGVQTVVRAELEGLTAAGHEATVFTPLHSASRNDAIVALPTSRAFRPDGYPFVWRPSCATELIKRECTRRNIDLIHVHSEMNGAVAAYRAARELGIPLVFTSHGRLDVYGAEVLPVPRVSSKLAASLHSRVLTHEGLTIRADLPYTRTGVARRMWSLLISQAQAADAVLVPSGHLAAKIKALGVTTPLTVLPNALEDSVLALIGTATPRRLAPGEPLRMMWCGRVSPEKRPELFVRAARELGERVEANVYGDGVDRKALARESAGTQVTLHGAVPRSDVLAAMRDHHVLVSSSFDFDNQPMVMLEAIASGLPVIFCDPDLAETLPANGSVLTETPDARGIVGAVEALLREPGRIESLSNAMIAARDMVSIDTHVARLTAAYEAALSRVPTH